MPGGRRKREKRNILSGRSCAFDVVTNTVISNWRSETGLVTLTLVKLLGSKNVWDGVKVKTDPGMAEHRGLPCLL